DGDRAFKRNRLQRDRASRTADQNIGASTEADAEIARGADIFTSESARRQAGCRRKHSPSENASGADADVDPDHVQRAFVRLWRTHIVARHKSAFHGLVTGDDETDTRIDLAGEHPHLRPWSGRLRGCRYSADRREYNKQRTHMISHDRPPIQFGVEF